MQLTKDADLLVCCAYKEYLHRRRNHIPKHQANTFHPDFKDTTAKLSGWLRADYLYTIGELRKVGFVKTYLDGTFVITENCVIYMEQRFKNGFKEVTDFITKFIP